MKRLFRKRFSHCFPNRDQRDGDDLYKIVRYPLKEMFFFQHHSITLWNILSQYILDTIAYIVSKSNYANS